MAFLNRRLGKWVVMPGLALALVAVGCGGGKAPPPTPAASTPAARTPAPATPAPTTPAARPAGDVAAGEQVYNAQGCPACHTAKGKGGNLAPSLDGLYGSKVKLTTGQEVVADAAFIRESIVNPTANVVQGFQPIMPTTYSGLPQKDLDNLVAFIASLTK